MRKFFIYMALILCLTLVFCGHNKPVNDEVVETTEITTTITTTSKVTTSTRITTETTTSTTTTTTAETTEEVTEPIVTEPVAEYVEEYVEPVQEVEYSNNCYSDDNAVLLAMLIHHEASANYDGKVAVGNCVINRMNNWGLTLSGVIYSPEQFTVASYMYTYDDIDYQVATSLLSGGSTDTRIMYFDGNHGGLNWFYDSNHNYLYAA